MGYLNADAGAAREPGAIAVPLSADAAGRGRMADLFFNAATALAKFAARAIPVSRIAERVVEAHTAGDTLTADETGSVHTTDGAGGVVTLVLPAATVGLEFFFRVGAAFALQIDPAGTETIALPSTGVQGAAGKHLAADANGETLHLMCTKAGQWSVMGYTGTWTAES